ncbi:MAG: PhnD/SsuA/transferrin family substrate-binding protein [Thiolinea sp.]
MTQTIRLISCLGENTYPIAEQLTAYLTEKTDLCVVFDRTTPWLEASQKLATGEIQMGWICGMLYTLQQDQQARYQVLAKPIFAGHSEPLYFSYLVVRRDSPIQTIADLQGKHLVINDPDSYSGNHALWAHWAKLQHAPKFASVLESGAHSNSLRMVANSEADVAAIDCTVFDYWLKTDKPEMREALSQLHAIEQINPAPTPPLVIHQSVDADTTAMIRQALLSLNQSAWLERCKQAGLNGLVGASDQDYDFMRVSYRLSTGFRQP